MYMMRTYRNKPGDIGKGDVPCSETDLPAAEAELSDHLVSGFEGASSPRVKPLVGELIGDDGQVAARYSMRPAGAVKVPHK